LISPIAGKHYHFGTLDYTLFWEGLALVHEALKNKDETLAWLEHFRTCSLSSKTIVAAERAILVLDKDAVSGLKMADDYAWVNDHKPDWQKD
jgi:hypothetical protein